MIFDVDGVLVDSYEPHLASWQKLAAETGALFSREDFARTFGMTSREIIRACWPSDVVRMHGEAKLDARKEAHYRDLIAHRAPVMPGAAALIDALAHAGFRIAVGSSGPGENVDLAVRGLGKQDEITARVTGEDVTRGKPDPQVFLLAAQKLGVEPANCCVVEDAPAGVQAAHAAGMVCVGLVSRGRTHAELADAELVVERLEELTPRVISQLIQQQNKPGTRPGL